MNYLKPHTEEWFKAMQSVNPAQAVFTKQIIELAGSPEVCSVCGDGQAKDYKVNGRMFNSQVGVSVRLCDDCKTIRHAQTDESFSELKSFGEPSTEKIIWVKTSWTKDELDRKRVEFRIRNENAIHHGIGEFLVLRNPEDLLSIQILLETQGRNRDEHIQTRYSPLTHESASKIERHPDQSKAEFRLFDAV